MEQPGDNRATQFLIHKVAIDVQCGNAATVMATIPSSRSLPLCSLFKCLLLIYENIALYEHTIGWVLSQISCYICHHIKTFKLKKEIQYLN